MKTGWKWLAAVVVLALIGAVVLWRQGFFTASAPPEPASAPAPEAASAPGAAPAASEPAIRYPIEPASAPASAVGTNDPEHVLADVFGRKSVQSLFQVQDFAQRLVATVDNLGRNHASARLWPVNPAPGRFMVEERNGTPVVSADNGQRYTPYVLLLENVDMSALAAAYARMYPNLQQAYEQLGYPGRYFNDRLVQVIDQLLATPIPDAPLKVHLPTLGGAVRPERPWVLYEFDDPALQSLTAGQRLLLRMGPVNERRVKAKMLEFRALVTTHSVQR